MQDIELNPKGEETDRGVVWNSLFVQVFNEKEYVNVLSKQFFGLYITFWASKALFEEINDIRTEKISQGTNKGSCLALHFTLMESSFCFLNSQFVEGQGKIKQRNQQFQDILDNINFGKECFIQNHE